jgi:hypothetical protein
LQSDQAFRSAERQAVDRLPFQRLYLDEVRTSWQNQPARAGFQAYGIVALGTHEQLRRLYAQDWVGTYLPETVLVETLDGKWRAAFCYIAPAGAPRPATNDYIDRIVGPAKQYGFPAWYIASLESFRPE